MRWETIDRLVRVVIGTIVFTFFMYYSFVAAVMTGWTVVDSGLERLKDSTPGLLWSALLGVIAVGWTPADHGLATAVAVAAARVADADLLRVPGARELVAARNPDDVFRALRATELSFDITNLWAIQVTGVTFWT